MIREFTKEDHKALEGVANEMASIIRFRIQSIKGYIQECEKKLTYNAFASAMDELDHVNEMSIFSVDTRRFIEASRQKPEIQEEKR